MVAIVNAVGYPRVEGSMSHFTSEEVWFTANLEEESRDRGWVGRFMDETDPSLVRAVSFARNLSPIFSAFDTTSLQLNEVALLACHDACITLVD